MSEAQQKIADERARAEWGNVARGIRVGTAAQQRTRERAAAAATASAPAVGAMEGEYVELAVDAEGERPTTAEEEEYGDDVVTDADVDKFIRELAEHGIPKVDPVAIFVGFTTRTAQQIEEDDARYEAKFGKLGLRERVARSLMRWRTGNLTPRFEHCNIWIVWRQGLGNKCIVFNTGK